MVGRTPCVANHERIKSFDCAMRAYGSEPIVGHCPKRDAPWRLSLTTRTRSTGATRGSIQASGETGDATCFTLAPSAGAVSDNVRGFA